MTSNVGRVIYGFCAGFFGRDDYDDKRIEAEGWDWIVARPLDGGRATFAAFRDAADKQPWIEAWAQEDAGDA